MAAAYLGVFVARHCCCGPGTRLSPCYKSCFHHGGPATTKAGSSSRCAVATVPRRKNVPRARCCAASTRRTTVVTEQLRVSASSRGAPSRDFYSSDTSRSDNHTLCPSDPKPNKNYCSFSPSFRDSLLARYLSTPQRKYWRVSLAKSRI